MNSSLRPKALPVTKLLAYIPGLQALLGLLDFEFVLSDNFHPNNQRRDSFFQERNFARLLTLEFFLVLPAQTTAG